MFNILLIACTIVFGTTAKAQQIGPAESGNCSFLKGIRFRKGVDTIIVKATFRDAAEMIPGGIALETLDKEKKIKSKYFDYQIGFQPKNCLKTYYGPTNVHNRKLIFGKPSIMGRMVYVKCIVFERHEWEDHGLPFFVIIDIKLAKLKHK